MSSRKTVLRAFLFTDIVGATALKERIGDVESAAAIGRHDDLFRECLQKFDGEEHQNPGDSFFASFAVPSDALRCALEFQRGLSSLDLPVPLFARVGIHMGESVRVEDAAHSGRYAKLLGLAIDTTARVMGLARAGQVLLTRHAFDSVRQQVVTAPNGAAVEWRAHGPYRLRGVDDAVEIFEAGVAGASPLSPPPDSAAGQRVVAPGDEETLGWRPAGGLPVPSRESWELERKLGEGAFGEVWLARHRETKYVRAFKFCFHAERLRSLKRELKLFRLLTEVLGDRPDIARLYEVRLDDPPYFLEMEYTAGGNLAEWADSFGGIRNVPLEARLELVAQVGEALAAAHSVGVIHKDLKPANILIHEKREGAAARRGPQRDASGALDVGVQARLTDFGIGELVSKDRLAEFGMTVSLFESVTQIREDYRSLTGTQLYVAPELLAGRPPTTRTDIYALGVLLMQVVVGDLNRPLAHGWEESVGDELLVEDIAACVAGDPANRLAAADDLSQRLRTLPQRRVARQSERRRRFMLRFSSIAAAILLVFSALAGIGLWQIDAGRREAEAARARAEVARQEADAKEAEARVEATKARRISDFLQQMLAAGRPEQAQGEDVSVLDVLDRAALEIDAELGEYPAVAAAVHATVGHSYYSLGRYREAEQQLSAAVELLRIAAGGANSLEVLDARRKLALVLHAQGRDLEAERELRAILDRQRALLGDAALPVLDTMSALAEVLSAAGKFEETEALYRTLLDLRKASVGGDHPAAFEAMNNLAAFLRTVGRLQEAEGLFRENLARQKVVLGALDPQTLGTLNNLAGVLKRRGHLKEAEQYYREALQALRRVNGERHPNTLAAMNNLAALLVDLDQPDEAEPLYREALKGLQHALKSDHPTVLVTLHNLTRLVRAQGRPDEAMAMARELLSRAESGLPPDHWYRCMFRQTYADLLADAQRFEEAETELLAACAGLKSAFGTEDARTQGAYQRLVELYDAWGKPERAADYRAQLTP